MAVSDQIDAAARGVVVAFGCDPMTLERLGGGGFSGSMIIRGRAGDASLVFKSFSPAARDRVAWAHRLMRQMRSAGCREVPEVFEAGGGDTIVMDAAGRLWEAVRHIDGAATETPSADQAAAAAAALARLHVAAAAWPAAPPRMTPAPAVVRRIEQARRLAASPWEQLRVAIPRGNRLAADLAERLPRVVAVARAEGCGDMLQRVAALQAPCTEVQAVLRDIWFDHVLFAVDEPARVAGIVDYHAAAVDTPATDVARLIGSWRRMAAVSPDAAWPGAIAAYEAVRPLSPLERSLVPWLDASGTVLALDNWIRWILVEGGSFGQDGLTLARIDALIGRLERSIRWLHRPWSPV